MPEGVGAVGGRGQAHHLHLPAGGRRQEGADGGRRNGGVFVNEGRKGPVIVETGSEIVGTCPDAIRCPVGR